MTGKFILFITIIIIIVLGVQCDIYKNSYNISQLNSPPPSFSFISPPTTSDLHCKSLWHGMFRRVVSRRTCFECPFSLIACLLERY
jgi:hypothetical protein